MTPHDAPTPHNDAEILARRALKYARPPRQAPAPGTLREVLLFTRQEARYAVPVTDVMQVVAAAPITPLPGVPAFYRGVVNVRGQILTVLDVPALWGGLAAPPAARPPLIVIRPGGEGFTLALLADSVAEITALPTVAILPPEGDMQIAHVAGITPDGIAVLDVAALCADPRLIVNDEF